MLNQLDNSFADHYEEEAVAGKVKQFCEEVEISLIPMVQLFREKGRAISSTFKFWDDFLCRVIHPVPE